MYRKSIFLLIASTMLLIVISGAEAKEGFYMGLGAVYNTIGGDFDGNSDLQNGSEMIGLPDIDNGFGIDIQGGYGMTDNWAIEANLIGSRHSGTWAGLKRDAVYVNFSINAKYILLPSRKTQPYLLFGLSENILVIEDGSSNVSTGKLDDALLFGPGINLGAGIDQYPSQHVSVTLGVMYRYVYYADAEGTYTSSIISENGSGFTFLLATAYHF